MTLPSKTLFLIDGLGALLSAVLLGVVLVRFENIFGMPRHVLYVLSIIAGLLSVYSLTSYFLIRKNPKPYLKILAIANFLYCCLTVSLVFSFYKELSYLGLIYFLAEVGVIVTLAGIELSKASKMKS